MRGSTPPPVRPFAPACFVSMHQNPTPPNSEEAAMKREIVLAYPVRTAIGTYGGSLKGTPATDLGAVAVRRALEKSGLAPERIGSVVMGNVIQAGNRMNPARQAAIGGGLPVSVPARTVNGSAGSGAQAVVTAAQEIELGLHDAAIAGGMENMDRAPYLVEGGRWGYRMGDGAILDSMLRATGSTTPSPASIPVGILRTSSAGSRSPERRRTAGPNARNIASVRRAMPASSRRRSFRSLSRAARAKRVSRPTRRLAQKQRWKASPS